MKATQKISLLAAVAAVALCGGSAYAASPKASIAKHVVLIGVDGFGARWIPWDKMPNLRALRDGGLYATGRDSYPTSSAINWATAFFGTVVEVHGYRNWNSAKPDIPPPPAALEGGRLPCVFSEIRRQDPAAYTLADITVTLTNRGLFPAEWLDIHAEAAPGDIAVYSLTGEGSDIPARDTAQVNLKLVTTAMPDAVRDITIQYHIHGMQRTITVR